MHVENCIKGVTYEELEQGVTYGEPEHGVIYVSPQMPKIQTDFVINPSKLEDGGIKIPPDIVSCNVVNSSEVIVADLLNFDLRLIQRIVKVYDTESGEKFDYTYRVEVRVKMRHGEVQTYEKNVDSYKIKKQDWLNLATHSLASVPHTKEEREAFEDKVQRCIETPNVPTEIIYPNAGWRNVPKLGWRYVFQRGIIGSSECLIHTRIDKYSLMLNHELIGTGNTFFEAIKMVDICKNGLSSLELFLFVHTSVLTTLFEKAGFPVSFVFGIVGVTNSRKTSMALAIAKIFDRHINTADAEYATSTECGIEKVLSLYKDGVVLVDDFKPGTNQTQQRSMDKKLDTLVRYYGNRVSKKRMLDFNTDGDKKYFPINGVCVTTLEVVTGVLSTISRMFITEINKDDVDNAVLTFYQENRWILPTHLYDFISWVTDHFEQAINYIAQNFDRLRCKHRFEVGRYAEMFATIFITAEILTNYAIGRGFWSVEDKELFLLKVENALLTEIANMERRIKKRDKAFVIVNALREALSSGWLKPAYLNKDTCGLRLDCYEDEGFIYIRSSWLKKVVYNYCKAFHEHCEITSTDELTGLLERVQVLDVLETTKGRENARKLPMQKGNTLRYLYLKKDKMEEIWND